MFISYNGVTLQCLKVEQYSVTPVYDSLCAADYLWDHVVIDAVCLVSQGATDLSNFPDDGKPKGGLNQQLNFAPRTWNQIAVDGVFGAVAQPQGGRRETQVLADGTTGPASTLVELFERLRMPRKQLRVWMESNPDLNAVGAAAQENVLYSPLPGHTVDCTHGPCCSYLQPMTGLGGNTALTLRVQFETDIPGCTEAGAPTLLSNRWSYRVTTDTDCMSIHEITGEVRFREDLLHEKNLIADQFRRQFLHPIPKGFKRDPVSVEISPGGNVVNYTIVDREMKLSTAPGTAGMAVTRVEIEEFRNYRAPIGLMSRYVG